MTLGSPAWPNPRRLHPSSPAIPVPAYSVQLGTRLLTSEALCMRSQCFSDFVAEVGGSLPPDTLPTIFLLQTCARLWPLAGTQLD